MNNKNECHYEQYDKAGYYEHLTYGEHLKLWAKKYKSNIAIVDKDKNITYLQLDEATNRAAAFFCSLGIKKKEYVLVQLSNTISFAVACFGLFKMGAVPVLLYPALREKEIQTIIEQVQPTAYITLTDSTDFNFKMMAEKLMKQNKCISNLITDTMLNTIDNYFDSKSFAYSDSVYSDSALLLLSGGSAGIPKLISRTHGDHYYTPKKTSQICKLDNKSIVLIVMPVSHNWNLCGPGLLGTLSCGGKVILSNHADPEAILSMIEKEKVTMASFVPSLAALCVEARKRDSSNDISSLSLLQLGGSLTNQKLIKDIKNLFHCQVQQIYGMGEGFVSCTSLDDKDEIIESCQGHPIANDEIKVIDENGINLDRGKEGELLVKGPSVITEYFCSDENTNKKFFTEDGFYCTGDKARILQDGTIQILGRIKEQINRAGEKIMPIEVEEALCQYSSVLDAAVIPLPDELLGQNVCAFIQTIDDTLTYNKVKSFLESIGIAAYKIPDQIFFIKEWPLTLVGKIDKKVLTKIALDSEKLSETEEASNAENQWQTEKTLTSIWKKILKRETIHPTDNFFELGGDSLSAMLLTSEIEKAFRIKLKNSLIYKHQTLSDLKQEIDKIIGRL